MSVRVLLGKMWETLKKKGGTGERGVKGDTGDKGDAGEGSDEKTG